MLFGKPAAIARLCGNRENPGLRGTVEFIPQADGVLIVARVCGLPLTDTQLYGFHIHEGGECSGDFSTAGSHYDPCGKAHPNHAGDLPPLLGCGGRAFLAVKTGRFCLKEIIGRTVVIHSHPDDLMTQPAGNAGTKIACGVISRV